MGARLAAWGLSWLRQARDKWWLWILFAVWEVVKDRIAGIINQQINSQEASLLMNLVSHAWSWLTLPTLLILSLFILLIHAYIDTRPGGRKTRVDRPSPPPTPTQSPTPAEFIRLDYADWTPITGLPWYVLFFRGKFFAIMDFAAYDYYDRALNDNERQTVRNQWRTSKRYPFHWTKKMVYDLVPVYLDPEGYPWRKAQIQELQEPARRRLKNERPDVWGFFEGEPEAAYLTKYPGRLPYDSPSREPFLSMSLAALPKRREICSGNNSTARLFLFFVLTTLRRITRGPNSTAFQSTTATNSLALDQR